MQIKKLKNKKKIDKEKKNIDKEKNSTYMRLKYMKRVS